jgi:hypothetical protein
LIQISASGFSSNGASSSEPRRISTTSSSSKQPTRPPQRGQKLRPSYVATSPSSSKRSRGHYP